tara:strand:+ start:938 stop:1120 length:183 start_codon:yes stop_codon:yes gene_type:complete
MTFTQDQQKTADEFVASIVKLRKKRDSFIGRSKPKWRTANRELQNKKLDYFDFVTEIEIG